MSGESAGTGQEDVQETQGSESREEEEEPDRRSRGGPGHHHQAPPEEEEVGVAPAVSWGVLNALKRSVCSPSDSSSSRANITLSGKKRRKLIKQLQHMSERRAARVRALRQRPTHTHTHTRPQRAVHTPPGEPYTHTRPPESRTHTLAPESRTHTRPREPYTHIHTQRAVHTNTHTQRAVNLHTHTLSHLLLLFTAETQKNTLAAPAAEKPKNSRRAAKSHTDAMDVE